MSLKIFWVQVRTHWIGEPIEMSYLELNFGGLDFREYTIRTEIITNEFLLRMLSCNFYANFQVSDIIFKNSFSTNLAYPGFLEQIL